MCESGREALPDVREWSDGPPECPGVVGRPSWMSGSGRVALPDVREWLGNPAGCLGVVWRPSQMSKSGWETLPDVHEALLDVREWSEVSPGSREAHSDARDLSEGYHGCLRVVGRPTRMSRSDPKTLPNVQEWSGDPSGCP